MVDERDREMGDMEKMQAHREGRLHRAFSVILFNSKGEMLLQKRSAHKYHSGGLWTNACCSHPRPGESTATAVQRKLKQEMGIQVVPEFAFKFQYKAEMENGLIEHEVDHVYTGIFDGEPVLNPEEAEDWKFVNVNEVRHEVEKNPDLFTVWFRKLLFLPELEGTY